MADDDADFHKMCVSSILLFIIGLDHFSLSPPRFPTPHAPYDMLYLVQLNACWMLTGAWLSDLYARLRMDPIFSQANDTSCRVPLTDLFDTVTATCAYGKRAFVARPVVGGVFAKMLAPNPYP